MLKALYTAATGMRSQQTQVDVIANNLANVNTSGYKKSDARFEDLLYVNMRQPGAANKDGSTMSGLQLGSGSQLVATARSFQPGALIQTGNPLDLAISGNGFFELQALDGTRVFTRDGSFQLDRDGAIVTTEGLKLVPSVGAVPQGAQATDLTIGKDGTVSVRVGEQITQLGQITLVTFPNAAGLSAEGGNLFRETPASGTPTTSPPGEGGSGPILQGNLERSNVDIATELISLILAQRAYEVNTKAITTADQMLQSANQLAR
jgi:flagellar basal-body rod protein FlgG